MITCCELANSVIPGGIIVYIWVPATTTTTFLFVATLASFGGWQSGRDKKRKSTGTMDHSSNRNPTFTACLFQPYMNLPLYVCAMTDENLYLAGARTMCISTL